MLTITVSVLLLVMHDELEGLSHNKVYIVPVFPKKFVVGSVPEVKDPPDPDRIDHSPFPTALSDVELKHVEISVPALKSLYSHFTLMVKE